MLELVSTIKSLSRLHPIFHSRTDFNDALASALRLMPIVSTNYHVPSGLDTVTIDVWAEFKKVEIPIQLMYKTRAISVKTSNDEYNLKSHAAQDQGRYDFLKRVEQIEKIVNERNLVSGFAVLLTNDSAYWKLPRSLNSADAKFRVHEERVVNGELYWGEKASLGTKKGRERTIILRNSYEISWNDYSDFAGQSYGKFRFLAIEVTGPHDA